MSRTCPQCAKDVEHLDTFSIWGTFCSDECSSAFHDERAARHAQLRVEPLIKVPDELTVADFETFALKVAVYAIFNLHETEGLSAGLRTPELLALRVKELLVRQLSEEYVSSWREGSGWTRQGWYSFKRPIPRGVLFEAMRSAGFGWNVSWL